MREFAVVVNAVTVAVDRLPLPAASPKPPLLNPETPETSIANITNPEFAGGLVYGQEIILAPAVTGATHAAPEMPLVLSAIVVPVAAENVPIVDVGAPHVTWALPLLPIANVKTTTIFPTFVALVKLT